MIEPTDFEVLQAMRRYGGSFASSLALAGFHADAGNLDRIKTAFPEIWQEYVAFAVFDKAKEEAKKQIK